MLNKLIFFIILSFGLIACHSNEDLSRVTKKVNDRTLREKLNEYNQIDFDYFYAKLNVDYKSNLSDQSFKTSIKMTTDSAFSGIISYAGFIMANFVADQDSLKVLYKQKKCYFTEDISYISTIIGVDLEYDFFEKLLLGKPVGIEEDVKYKQIKNENYYVLSSHKKSAYKRIEKEKIDLDDNKNDGIFIRYYFSPDSLRLVKTVIELPVDSVNIIINYIETIKLSGVDLPKYSTLEINHPKDIIKIGLSYKRHLINHRKKHVFSIPDSYDECIE